MTDKSLQKLEDLQVLLTHQAKEIAELNEVVTAQANEIDAIKKYMRATKAKMTEIEHSMGDIGQDSNMSISDEAAANKPPHY